MQLIEEETENLKLVNNKFKDDRKINQNLIIKINNLQEEYKKLHIQLLDIKSLISITEHNLDEQYIITSKLKYLNDKNEKNIITLNNKLIELEYYIYYIYISVILIYIIYYSLFNLLK